ncbi:MAG: DUF3810 domain-containing protein, partial [Oscillospiraceae bacterium]|nr:DUF3810 domain-containing protein [Oscillospiraceae bacterium]
SVGVMNWAVSYISNPARSTFAFLSAIYPIALFEIFATALGLFLIYYIIKSIRDSWRRRNRWKLLGRRFLPILVAAFYLWGAFCWIWNSGYFATGFAEKYGLTNDGVNRSDLVAVTRHFAEKANELSLLVERDEDGKYIMHRQTMFAESVYIYRNISTEFPSLNGRLYSPKPMYLYSWLMSITGYTGMYFALTGEAMINIQPPGLYMPSTVAHEHAHKLGVFAEDEANFVAILACITSDNPTFQYAGYMLGLHYLLGAIAFPESYFSSSFSDEWYEISTSLTREIERDRQDNWDFWAKTRTSNIGVEFIDNILSNVMEITRDVVDNIYDDFLQSQNQELGLRSYGACVDLLVEYFKDSLHMPQEP